MKEVASQEVQVDGQQSEQPRRRLDDLSQVDLKRPEIRKSVIEAYRVLLSHRMGKAPRKV